MASKAANVARQAQQVVDAPELVAEVVEPVILSEKYSAAILQAYNALGLAQTKLDGLVEGARLAFEVPADWQVMRTADRVYFAPRQVQEGAG